METGNISSSKESFAIKQSWKMGSWRGIRDQSNFFVCSEYCSDVSVLMKMI